MLIAIFYKKLFTEYCLKTRKTVKSIYKSISTSPILKCLITTITKTNKKHTWCLTSQDTSYPPRSSLTALIDAYPTSQDHPSGVCHTSMQHKGPRNQNPKGNAVK